MNNKLIIWEDNRMMGLALSVPSFLFMNFGKGISDAKNEK